MPTPCDESPVDLAALDPADGTGAVVDLVLDRLDEHERRCGLADPVASVCRSLVLLAATDPLIVVARTGDPAEALAMAKRHERALGFAARAAGSDAELAAAITAVADLDVESAIRNGDASLAAYARLRAEEAILAPIAQAEAACLTSSR